MHWLVLFSMFCVAVNSKKILVLVDNLTMKETHSLMFKSFSERGMEMTIRTADDASLKLRKYGQLLYDTLVIFSPSVEEFGGDVSVDEITHFVDNGGNLMVACNEQTTDTIRDLASQMGLEVDEEGANVIDHINYDGTDDGTHTLVVSSAANLVRSTPMVGESARGAPLLYRGTGLLLDSSNQLVVPVLHAEPSAYSHRADTPVSQTPHAMGTATVLIAALQARNNARVLFSGSLDFFSDKFFTAPVHVQDGPNHNVSGNHALALSLSAWLLGETGLLRVGRVHHHRLGETSSPSIYTIKEHVVYSIEVEELVAGQWLPHRATDMQLQLVRIDPFVRVQLAAVAPDSAWLRCQLQLPDVYGVYKLEVHYQRLGYTRLHSVKQVSVRPLQHTEYERFILSAYPYYASAFSMMLSCLLFSCVFLHYRQADHAKPALKTD